MTTLVVGLGQRVAGDDAVGLAVLDEIERRGVSGISLVRAREPSALVELVAGHQRTIVVDAVLVPSERVGEVLVIAPDELDPEAQSGISSHGLSVAQALELCQVLYPESGSNLRLVAVGIQAPDRYGEALSPPVQAAVRAAADQIEAMVRPNDA